MNIARQNCWKYLKCQLQISFTIVLRIFWHQSDISTMWANKGIGKGHYCKLLSRVLQTRHSLGWDEIHTQVLRLHRTVGCIEPSRTIKPIKHGWQRIIYNGPSSRPQLVTFYDMHDKGHLLLLISSTGTPLHRPQSRSRVYFCPFRGQTQI